MLLQDFIGKVLSSTVELLTLLCLTSIVVSASNTRVFTETTHASGSQLSQESALTQSSTLHYMKPSEFFNRYFDCRYNLKLQFGTTQLEDSIGANYSDQHTPQSAQSEASIRHTNKRQTVSKSCPEDCDGITRWPETEIDSVRQISCLEVLKSLKQKVQTVFVDDSDLESGTAWSAVNSESSFESIDNAQPTDSYSSDGKSALLHPDHVSIESYMFSKQQLSQAAATRRCSQSGTWESQANYTPCGLESKRLFVLTTKQLDKIYEIREKMIQSKFTQNYRSEQEFVNCVNDVLSLKPAESSQPFCERTFDGWTCFNDTLAGQVVYFQCPDFIYGFNPQNEAHKTCTADGKWKVHAQTLQPWTNYTSCVDIPDLHFRNIIINLHIIGYCVSLVALLISLAIFISFKSLSSQTRIRIHKNFFVSFIFNNFVWIIWYFAITDQKILLENGYFLVCNYFWMFCEGLYLHTILVIAFVSEGKILKWFYLIGWGIPALFASAYAILRANSPDAHNCWVDESKYTWILNVPVCISFVLNIFFLINIVRVLVMKLQAVNTADTHQTRKAVRATLILIPLLGLHFILTPFRPETNSPAAQAYEVFSAIVSSMQGFCVAMLFCFFNGEVLSHIRKRWNQFLLVHGYGTNRRMSYGGTTVSFVANCRAIVRTSSSSTNTTNLMASKKSSLAASEISHHEPSISDGLTEFTYVA